MGYVEDEAMARELMRQRLLHGGMDPAQVKATQDYMDQYLAQTRPRGVTQTQTEALKPYINAVGRSPSVASYTPPSDDSLGKALANMFTGSSNLGRAAQVQVAKEQADREAAKKGGGAAAPSTAPPGPPPVPPASLFPGLRAGVDASQAPPGAPAAEAYYAQHEPIPGVRGRVGPTVGPEGPMPSPQAAAPAPGSSSTLASQRAGYKAFFDANPDAKERMAALTLAEEGDNPKNPTAAS